MAAVILSCIFLLLWSYGVKAKPDTEKGNFTVYRGQIYTSGLVIIDAPQPNTPEGGDLLQLALDVSGDGKLPLPPYVPNSPTGFFNITAFLYSYSVGLNLTISNGTSDGWTDGCNATVPSGSSNKLQAVLPNAGCVPIMLQEPGSTVKHVNFLWPECMVGDGGGNSTSTNGGTGLNGMAPVGAENNAAANGNARGEYNISIHQSFRLNNTNHYTVFDLPISISNLIPSKPLLSHLASDSNSSDPSSSSKSLAKLSSKPSHTLDPRTHKSPLGAAAEAAGSAISAAASASRLPCSQLLNPLLTPEQVSGSESPIQDGKMPFAPVEMNGVNVSVGAGGASASATAGAGQNGTGLSSEAAGRGGEEGWVVGVVVGAVGVVIGGGLIIL